MPNVLTDVPWIRAVNSDGVSYLTVVDVLARAHEQGLGLDKNVPGYVFGTQFRFLREVLTIVLRCHPQYAPGSERDLMEDMLAGGIPADALKSAQEALGEGLELFSKTLPFMQRPPAPMQSPKDSARLLVPGKQPIKKLLPAMPSDQGEDFWNLVVAQESSLDLPQAVLYLAIHHYYSMAGNNTYDDAKCAMGAPGIRFLGKGFASTEIFWEGETLLETLTQSIPMSWVSGQGLPAWCDREGKTAFQKDGSEHPLWRATWSSNTAACLWENDRLVGVRIGGIPDSWYLPTMGGDKESRKAWWDQRNTEDPMYLYLPNQQGDLKAHRLDLSRDATDLAVEWAAEGKIQEAQNRKADAFYTRDASPLRFIRHQIEGTASSPSIRASQVYTPDQERWIFGAEETVQERIIQRAVLVKSLHNIVCSPFRRKNEGDKKRELEGKAVALLENLELLKADISAEFWRHITPVYVELLTSQARARDVISPENNREALNASLAAFDRITQPFRNQNRAQFEYVRGVIESRLRWQLSQTNQVGDKKEGK